MEKIWKRDGRRSCELISDDPIRDYVEPELRNQANGPIGLFMLFNMRNHVTYIGIFDISMFTYLSD